MEKEKITIYGDSLMRGTVPDEDFRYHYSIKQYIEYFQDRFGLTIRNRAVFGSCVAKGEKQLEKDLEGADIGDIALIEFGGNDCNFHWDEIARNPSGSHLPYTVINKFSQSLRTMAGKLMDKGVRPVMMTLPPIIPRRYLDYICRTVPDRDSIMKWLGNVDKIYRVQEKYSEAVAKIANETKCRLVDVRSAFLLRKDLDDLVSGDGIHPSASGYDLMAEVFAGELERTGRQPV